MNSNWSYSPETPNLGQIRRFLEPCDLEIWRMTLKNNRAPLLCCFQLCAWFHCHMWIQTGVRVRKRLSWVLTSVILTFDLWPWPFAWTSLLTMVITPENFMMISVGEKRRTHRTFPMARPKCLMRDFTNLYRIYRAHQTNVWWTMQVFCLHWMIRWWEHGEKGVTDRRTDGKYHL